MIDPDQRLIGTIDDVVSDDHGQPIWAVKAARRARRDHVLDRGAEAELIEQYVLAG